MPRSIASDAPATDEGPILREGSFEEALTYWTPPTGITRGFVDGRFGQMHYRMIRPASETAASESKTPLVFLHQSPSSGRVFEGLMAKMGTDRLCVAIDTPGFGDSNAPAAPPTIADYSAAIGDALDALELGEVDLFGDHTGAKVGGVLAMQRPEQVRRLIFNACPVYPADLMAKMAAHLEDEKEHKVDEDGSHIAERWEAMQKWYKPGTPVDLYDRDIAESFRPGSLAWYGHNAAFSVNHADNLPNIHQPLLIICPDDGLWDATQTAAPFIKNGRLLERPNWGMGAVSLHTVELASDIRGFLDGPADEAKNPPPPVAIPDRPRKIRDSIRKQFVETSMGALHVRQAGVQPEGTPPIICLHMSPVSGRGFEPLMNLLAKDRLVYTIDLPAFGESAKPSEVPTIAQMANAIWDAVRTLCPDGPIDFIGDHTGSMISLQLAADHPNDIHRLALNTIPHWTESERAERLEHAAYVPAAMDGSHLTNRWGMMNRLSGPGVTMEMIERNFVEALRGGPLGHWPHRAVFSHDLTGVLPRVAQPVLVFCPRDGLEGQTQNALPLLQNGQLHDLPDCRYFFLEAQAPEFAKVIAEFLGA